MSRLSLDQQVPNDYNKVRIQDIIRAICLQLNQLSEGKLTAKYNAQSVVPAGSVSYAVGDFVPDLNTTVRGSISPGIASNYVRIGWVCTTAGTPGTFQEVRVATGT